MQSQKTGKTRLKTGMTIMGPPALSYLLQTSTGLLHTQVPMLALPQHSYAGIWDFNPCTRQWAQEQKLCRVLFWMLSTWLNLVTQYMRKEGGHHPGKPYSELSVTIQVLIQKVLIAVRFQKFNNRVRAPKKT